MINPVEVLGNRGPRLHSFSASCGGAPLSVIRNDVEEHQRPL
jgi:hypothetical protein